MTRRKLKRLVFQHYQLWKMAHYVGRAYVARNVGPIYWITSRVDPERVGQKRSWGHLYLIWTLYIGPRKIGEFRALPDATLAAQHHWEGFNWHWLSKERQEKRGRVFRPRLHAV